MAKKASFSVSEYFFKHRILFLLATIIGFIIGSPFTDEIFRHGLIPDLLLTIIFIFGIYAISRKKKHIYIAIVLATPMIISVWVSYFSKSLELYIVGEFFRSALRRIYHQPVGKFYIPSKRGYQRSHLCRGGHLLDDGHYVGIDLLDIGLFSARIIFIHRKPGS